MSDDDYNGFVVCHLVATMLSAMWHLECVSAKGRDGDNLLCMMIMLGIITIRQHCVVGIAE